MNIEDERKAFLLGCCDMMGNAYYPADTGFANGEFYDPTVQRLFAVWIKAKAHAEEMLKTPVMIKKRPFKLHGYGVYNGPTYHCRLHISDSQPGAYQWAKANGYRVIE